MLWSEYTLKTTGCGLPAGPGGLLGALEGISYLFVVGLVGFSVYTKVLCHVTPDLASSLMRLAPKAPVRRSRILLVWQHRHVSLQPARPQRQSVSMRLSPSCLVETGEDWQRAPSGTRRFDIQ